MTMLERIPEQVADGKVTVRKPKAAANHANAPWQRYTTLQRAGLLAALFMIGTSSYIDRNVMGVLMEPIKLEFAVSDTALGLLTGLSFALLYATLGLPVARWADYGNRRTIITLSIIVWSLMTAASGLVAGFWLLAMCRVGVGAGEAGAVPASQSLIGDYFPPERRGGALGIYMLSAMAGNVIGLIGGGWIAQHHGWRATFLAVGIPGIALAAVAHFTLSEPRENGGQTGNALERETIVATLATLWRKPSYRFLVGAMILYFLMTYGALIFTPSLLIRVYRLDVAQAGALYGTISAFGALIGTLAGGWSADLLAKRNIKWLGWLPGIALIVAMPVYQAAYLAPSTSVLTPILFVATILLTAVVPPLFAALQLVCGGKRRASAVAIAFFFANLIGLGLGPLLSGGLSDLLARSWGAAVGLQYAMVIVMTTFLPAGLCLILAGRHLMIDRED